MPHKACALLKNGNKLQKEEQGEARQLNMGWNARTRGLPIKVGLSPREEEGVVAALAQLHHQHLRGWEAGQGTKGQGQSSAAGAGLHRSPGAQQSVGSRAADELPQLAPEPAGIRRHIRQDAWNITHHELLVRVAVTVKLQGAVEGEQMEPWPPAQAEGASSMPQANRLQARVASVQAPCHPCCCPVHSPRCC